MEEKLDLVLAQLKSISDEVSRLNKEVSTLNTGQKIMFAKQHNMTKGPYEPLEKFPTKKEPCPPSTLPPTARYWSLAMREMLLDGTPSRAWRSYDFMTQSMSRTNWPRVWELLPPN